MSRVKIHGVVDDKYGLICSDVKSHHAIPKDKIIVVGKDIYYYGEKLPHVPTESSHIKTFISDDYIYVNTFEWKNGRWERSLRAIWYYLFG